MPGARWVLLAALGWAATAAAQADNQTERKVQESFVTDLAQVQNQGSVQVQSGLEWDRGDPDAGIRTPLDLEFGVTDRFQLEASAELGLGGETNGARAGNVFTGVQYSPYDSEDLGLSVATGVGIELPFGALEATDQYRAVPQVAAYKRFGPLAVNLMLDAEVSIASRSGAPLEEPTVGAGLTAFYASGERLFPVVEAFAETGNEDRVRLAGGVIAAPLESVQLGVAFVLTREHAETSPGVFGNLVWGIGQ